MIPKAGIIQLYKNIKQDEKLKSVPIIMLSDIDTKTFSQYLRLQDFRWGQEIPEPNAYLKNPPEADHLLGVINLLTNE